MKPLSTRLQIVLMILMLLFYGALAFSVGFLGRAWYDRQTGDLPLLKEAYNLLKTNALNPIPEEPALEYGMIHGMTDAYGDPYTVFVEPAQHELDSNTLKGSFGGIGARMEVDAEKRIRIYPFPDSPAKKAGIQDGDRLEQVNDIVITLDVKMEDVLAEVRGEVGTKVRITVSRPPEPQTYEFTIERAEIPLPSLTYNLLVEDAQVGIIHVNIIASSTPDEISRAVDDLKLQGMEYLILDLRNNGGGVLDGGIGVVRLFLKDGVIMKDLYKGQEEKTYTMEEPGPLSDLPLVVLVNGNTASASEIIASSLQGNGRAKLIGSPTFGKDVIQLVFTLSDKSSLHVTTARWWVPDNPLPLQPDIPAGDAIEESSVLLEAIKALRQP